jgi:hypothetical protein
MLTNDRLPKIPVYDVGPNFPMEVAERLGEDRGYELLRVATAGVPNIVLRGLDRISRWWLDHYGSQYLAEIDELASRSREPGLYYLNIDYEWGCSSAARPGRAGALPVLQRTLDWEIPGLGSHVVAARIGNPLGPWVSLTWPAFTGVIQAIAPGRFAASINQPSPPRLTGSLLIDRLFAKRRIWSSRATQPIHLLRQVFESAPDFATALAMLEQRPITTSAIFTLAGVHPGETAVIERRPNSARVLEDSFAVNEWRTPEWRPGHHAAFENEARLAAMRAAAADFDETFAWATWPILNKDTRLAMLAEPASGRLIARGYEACEPATQALVLPEPRPEGSLEDVRAVG